MNKNTEKKLYTSPETIEIGRILELTGHCSSGCDHDSVVHTDEFKSASGEELEALVACG